MSKIIKKTKLSLSAFSVTIIMWGMCASAQDKTGTNPVNFTNDFRIYNEQIKLNTEGDGSQSVTTVEYRTPFADGKWQYRVRARHNSLEADLSGNGIDDVDDSGAGVVDMRFLTVPYLNMPERKALAVGLEIGLPTGEQQIGSDATTLGPQVFGVFFVPFGISDSLIAPAYQYKFSVDEEGDSAEVSQSLFDLFFLKTYSDKRYWFMLNPQYVIDHETDAKFGFVDVEAGMMLDELLGTRGHSAYLRPSFGFGQDKVTEHAIEIGYKVIW